MRPDISGPGAGSFCSLEGTELNPGGGPRCLEALPIGLFLANEDCTPRPLQKIPEDETVSIVGGNIASGVRDWEYGIPAIPLTLKDWWIGNECAG